MADTERVLGELKEFKRATLSELCEMKRELRELNRFKWKSFGFLTAFVVFTEAAKWAWEHASLRIGG